MNCLRPISLMRVLWLLLLAGLSMPLAAAEKEASKSDGIGDRFIVMGVSPEGGAAAVFSQYGPVVAWLNEKLKLKQTIVLESAPTEALFRQRTHARMYDIIVTAPHLVLEETDKGIYILIAMPDKKTRASLVVHEQSTLKKPADLAGKVVATASTGALLSRAMVARLEKQGLSGSAQPVYMALGSDKAALDALLKNEADAVIVSDRALRQAKKDKASVRTIGKPMELPGAGVMVASDLPDDLRSKLKKLLTGMAKSGDGKKAMAALPFSAFNKGSARVYQPMRVYMIRDEEPQSAD